MNGAPWITALGVLQCRGLFREINLCHLLEINLVCSLNSLWSKFSCRLEIIIYIDLRSQSKIMDTTGKKEKGWARVQEDTGSLLIDHGSVWHTLTELLESMSSVTIATLGTTSADLSCLCQSALDLSHQIYLQ